MNRKQFSKSLLMSIAALEAAIAVASARSQAPEGYDPQNGTTINSYSTEVNQGLPPNYAPLKPNQREGRIRISSFTRVYTTEAAGDNTALCLLPKGARVVKFEVAVSATTGTATLAFGLMGKDLNGNIDDTSGATVVDNVAFFAAAAAITTTPKVDLANTIALNWLYETKKEVYVTVSTAVAAMAGQTLRGYVAYVVD